jgi:type III restriction enzyme
MSLAVDNPIINSPFEEPTHYWDYKEGHPVLSICKDPAMLKESLRKIVF